MTCVSLFFLIYFMWQFLQCSILSLLLFTSHFASDLVENNLVDCFAIRTNNQFVVFVADLVSLPSEVCSCHKGSSFYRGGAVACRAGSSRLGSGILPCFQRIAAALDY